MIGRSYYKTEKPPEIEIMGHKAKITTVSGLLKDDIWRKEDELSIQLSFDEAVGSTLSYGICLPVKNYGREEFLEAVRREGEAVLGEIMKKDLERHEKRAQQEARQEDLDSLARQLGQMIEK